MQLILIQVQEFARQNLEFSLKKQGKPYPLLHKEIFHKKILILNKGIREAKIMIGGALGSPGFRVKTHSIYFHDTCGDILLGNNFTETFGRYMQDN